MDTGSGALSRSGGRTSGFGQISFSRLGMFFVCFRWNFDHSEFNVFASFLSPSLYRPDSIPRQSPSPSRASPRVPAHAGDPPFVPSVPAQRYAMQVDTKPTASIASLMASAPKSASIPQKRKDPPAHAPVRPREPERAASQSETDAGTHSTSPTDEYGSGRIICESCGEGISIKDEATGGFTVKHWDAHRNSCQNGSASTVDQLASEAPSTTAEASQPQAKRRRAKRTEEERIEYLRTDPYVAKYEAYRVLCASCDKWIRLRPNSTYCSIPWDAHRKSCLAKRVAKNAHPVDDRSAAFASDPNVKRFDSSRVQCRSCEKWIPILTDDNAAAIKAWKQHRDACQPQPASSPRASTSKFNIANVPPPPKHLLALASSSSLPPPASASARAAVTQSTAHPGQHTQPAPVAFKDYTPNNYPGTQESRRRNADQRAAALRADTLLGEVEPNRVFCKMCHKWVQLRQDSTYCAYPWLQHRAKCLKKHQKISGREAEIAELRATRDAALEGELEVTDSSANSDPEEDDDEDDTDRERRKAERRRAKALAKAEAAAARLRQLEDARAGRAGSVASSEDDDAMWDYMDVDMVLPPRLADLDSPSGRLEFVSRSVRHLFRITYARSDELTIAALVTYLNAAMPPDKYEDFDTAEVTKMTTTLHERGTVVFEGDVIRIPT
ncbi:hypothetical protein BD311DRAFT_730013 [Dichomitus squalens]|uniref:Uncharacterized protein n=1 Tax=Dichomitus squalens TaxID=114155 RepID=A0A4Q9MEI9_9APHY|nr:hypothetical protein BD311DRAFT_730013 [Dichomitus squalens]